MTRPFKWVKINTDLLNRYHFFLLFLCALPLVYATSSKNLANIQKHQYVAWCWQIGKRKSNGTRWKTWTHEFKVLPLPRNNLWSRRGREREHKRVQYHKKQKTVVTTESISTEKIMTAMIHKPLWAVVRMCERQHTWWTNKYKHVRGSSNWGDYDHLQAI